MSTDDPAPSRDPATGGHWLVLNGKSAGDEAIRDAVRALREAGHRIEVRVTWEGGDAARIVAEALAAGAATLVAGGGDGTLSEVAQALAEHDAPADALPSLGLLPLGTANDFATAAGLPDDPAEALRIAVEAPAVPIDLLRLDANGEVHWAANLASGGFGTQVTTETHPGMKRVLGGLAYVVTGLSRLGSIEPIVARVRGDGFDWQGGFVALAIGNGRQAGGGQALCPRAVIDDGLLDVTVIPEPADGLPAAIARVVTGGRDVALAELAEQARLPWVEITAAEPLVLNLDGEPLRSTHFRIDCARGRLRMHLPANCALLSANAAGDAAGAPAG